MEGDVLCSYLRMKFSLALKEAETDLGSSLPFISRFQAIAGLISQNSTSGTADDLYDLVDMLSKCIVFAHQRREEATSKKGFYLFRVVVFERDMRRRVDDIEKKLKAEAIGMGPTRVDETGESKTLQSYPDSSRIIGFESYVRQIEDLLMAQRFKAIGIVGRCGCGKTALTREVLASPTIETNFSPRIWVGLSDILLDNGRGDLRVTILSHILREIGDDAASDAAEYGDHSVVKLLEMLQLGLMGKRYLIVLDDSWRMDDCFADLACSGQPQPPAESFTHGLPKGSGGAVIVTSRAGSVIRRMVGEEAYVLCPEIGDNHCWEIFSNAVRRKKKISLNDIDIEMRDLIIDSCEGLPLAANTLADLISNLLAEKREKNKPQINKEFITHKCSIPSSL